MSLVLGSFPSLACKVSPAFCISHGSTLVEIIPKAVEVNPEVLNVLNSRQSGLIPHQQERYDRMQRLVGDVSRIEGDIAAVWQTIENNGPYYLYILDEIAKMRGYTDAESMTVEADTFLAPGEAEELGNLLKTGVEALDLAFSVQKYTSAAVGTLSGASFVAGKYRWVGRSDTYNYSKFWRKLYVPLWTMYGRAGALYMFKTGRITEAAYKTATDSISSGVRSAAQSLPSGALKSSVFKFLGALGGAIDFIVGIGSLVVEGVLGARQRDHIREATKNLLAARYSAYYVLHSVLMIQNLDARIQAALDIRVTQQGQVNSGDLCYQAADAAVVTKLSQTLQAFNDAFDHLKDEDVYDNITLRYDGNAWTDEDINLDGIKTWIEDHASEGQAGSQDDPVPIPDSSHYVKGANVTAAYCNYVGFQGNKGALWKLNGPFWTLQAGFTFNTVPFDIGVGAAGNSSNAARNFRVRLDQIKRSNESIFVQYQGFTSDGRIALSTNPVIEINVPSDGGIPQLRLITNPQLTLGPDGVVRIGATGVTWTAFTIDAIELSNLVPSNEFTAWKANFEDPSLSLNECSIAEGWRHFGTDGFSHTQIRERERKNGLISAVTSTNLENFRIDVANKLFNHTVYILQGGTDPFGPPGTLVPTFEQLRLIDLEPRMVFT